MALRSRALILVGVRASREVEQLLPLLDLCIERCPSLLLGSALLLLQVALVLDALLLLLDDGFGAVHHRGHSREASLDLVSLSGDDLPQRVARASRLADGGGSTRPHTVRVLDVCYLCPKRAQIDQRLHLQVLGPQVDDSPRI